MVNNQYESIRVKDVESIRKRLTLKPDAIKNTFSVLIGPRGIGKTVAIETAAENLKGIHLVSIYQFLTFFQIRPLLKVSLKLNLFDQD